MMKRVRYFPGQLLSAADFETEQSYLRAKRRLHNRWLHGWGVVGGLTVSVGPNHAVGSGKLTTTSGTGTWRGQGPNGQCSGSWNAERSGS